MNTETEIGATETTSAADPGVGFQCGLGLWAGTVLAGAVSIALAATGADAVSVLGSYPTALTGGLVAGIVFSRNAGGLVERIGAGRHRRWLYGLAPAVVLGTGAVFAWFGGLGRVAAVASLAALPVALSGLGLAAMARNRYVDRVTGEPTASWTWKRIGLLRWEYGVVLPFLALGVVQAYWGRLGYGLLWLGYGALMLVIVVGRSGVADRLGLPRKDGDNSYAPDFAVHSERMEATSLPELAVHDAGLVTSRGRTKSLVPWSAIEDASLTDDELVIDRGWRTIRCDREVIDDPEGAYEALREAIGDGNAPSV